MQGDYGGELEGVCAEPPWDEAARLAALARYGILDSQRDAEFDHIAEIVAAMFEAPIAVVNFIASDRQWFKAEIGIGTDTLPLDVSICRFAILQSDMLVVPDLATDSRFAGNPLVAQQGGLRFYAGALLKTADGLPLGTVCVLDTAPRPDGITERQRTGLLAAADMTMAALERHAAARREQYLASLRDLLRAEGDPEAAMSGAARMLGEHLGVAQVGVGQIDEAGDAMIVASEWHDGRMPSLTGRWRFSDFGTIGAMVQAGHQLVIDDVIADAAIGPAQAIFQQTGTRAALVMPMVRDGRAVAALFINHLEARRWTNDDLELVQSTLHKLWLTVERHRAEAKTRTRSLELESLVTHAPIGLAYFDRGHRYIRVNAELASINGVSIDAHIGQRIEDLLPINANAVVPLLDQVFSSGEAVRAFEISGETPRTPGVQHHWLTSYFPVWEDGDVIAVGAWVIDITERRKEEEARKASEAMLRQAQELGGVGSWEWDHTTGIGRVSDSYCRLHGVDCPDGTLDRAALLAIMHPNDRASFLETVGRGLHSGERTVTEYRVLLPDGSIRSIRGIGQRIGDKSCLRTSGIVEDVTEARAQIEAVAASEAKFKSVYEQAAVGIARVAPDGTIVEANDRFAAIAGHEGSLVGKTFQTITHPDDLESDLENLSQLVAGTIPSYTIEKRYITSKGDTVWVNLAVGIVRDPHGEPSYFVSVIEDITERRLANERLAESEARVRALNAQLERRVAERTDALLQANNELKAEIVRREAIQAQLVQSKKLEALGRMTSGLAHDFNNLVAAITTGFTLISKWSDDPRVLEVAEHGVAAGDRGGMLVKQLMAFARQQKLELRSVDVVKVVNDAMPLIRRSLPGIDVTLDLAEDLPPVRTDAVQVESALINFAINARDAMERGGTFAVTARAVPQNDPALPPEIGHIPCVALTATDNGTGMSAPVLERVMEPFFTTKDVGRGTGLGLATVQGFAIQSGGALSIESVEGEGTSVTLWLPCTDAKADTSTAASAWITHETFHGRILLVDDDALVRTLTSTQLREMGLDVVVADNAISAIEELKGNLAFDAVITDIIMPGRDGFDLAEEIGQLWPQLPILFLTGNADRQRLAGRAVLDKPFSEAELKAAVSLLVTRSHRAHA
jgi:PAS domain S-box-containing protein